MINEFKAGDVIRLKSGGRAMTISGHAHKHTSEGNVPIEDKYECFWMDGSKLQKAVFHKDAILLIDEKPRLPQ